MEIISRYFRRYGLTLDDQYEIISGVERKRKDLEMSMELTELQKRGVHSIGEGILKSCVAAYGYNEEGIDIEAFSGDLEILSASEKAYLVKWLEDRDVVMTSDLFSYKPTKTQPRDFV